MAHRAPSGIAVRRAAIVGTEPALSSIATGLRRHGVAVATSTEVGGYDAALEAAAAAIGQLDAVVWVMTAPELGRPTPITAIDGDQWQRLVAYPLRSYVEFLQAAERRLHDLGGRVIVVLPTIAMSGASNLVAWATVAEGQRALAKSVARVWGGRRITVNCVAVPTALLVDSAEDLDRPNLQRAALPDPDLENDVASVIATLCGDGFAAVTGTTVGVDGGRWIPS